jgi:hypothetical protein
MCEGITDIELLEKVLDGPRKSPEEAASFAEEVAATAHLSAAELAATAKGE